MSLKATSWFQLVTQLKGSVVPAIMPRVVLCTGLGLLISALNSYGFPLPTKNFSNLIFPDLVLGLLLVFRTNSAYDRFWEGRKLWGTLVNTVRNFARQIWVMIPTETVNDTIEKTAILKLLVAFSISVKCHLRGEPINPEISNLTSPEQYAKLQKVNHPPLEIAFWIGDYLQRQYQRHSIHTHQLMALQKLLDTMVDVLGACERILKTPIPLAYQIHLQQILLLYCLILPFQLIHNLGWLTGLVIGIISFTLFGIEEIARQIENPFGHDDNDLPLDAICQTMLINIEDLISNSPSIQNASPDNKKNKLENFQSIPKDFFEVNNQLETEK